MVTCITNTLVSGDPLDPMNSDIIAQVGRLKVGNPAPTGWTVMDGNTRDSSVGRVVMRWQLED